MTITETMLNKSKREWNEFCKTPEGIENSKGLERDHKFFIRYMTVLGVSFLVLSVLSVLVSNGIIN